MAEMRIINLNQVERGVEQALRNFTNGGNGGEVPEISAGYYRSERDDGQGH